jgi:MFS family permease
MVAEVSDVRSKAREPAADGAAWRMIAVLLAFYMLSMIDRTIIVLLVEPIKTDIGLSDFQMSLVLGPAFGVAFALACIPSGWAADRLSRRWVIFSGVVFWATLTILCGLASSFLALFVARALVAVGEAMLTPSAYSLIGDRFPRSGQGKAIAAYNMGPKLGQSVAYFFGVGVLALSATIAGSGMPVLSALQPWQLVFVMAGAPGLVLAFLAFTFAEPQRRTTDAGAGAGDQVSAARYLWSTRAVYLPLILAFCLVGMVSGAVSNWSPSYLARTFGWTPTQYGSALGVISALAAVSLVPTGAALDHLYSRGVRDAAVRVYSWMLIVAAVAGTIIYLVGDARLFLVGFPLLTVCVVPFMVYLGATLNLIVPSALRGRLTGFLIMALSLFSNTFGPTAVAGLTDFVFHDPQKLGWSLAIVTSCGLAGAVVLLRRVLVVIQPMLPDNAY